MKNVKPEYIPVEGKTYSLFGDSDSTSEYYNIIRMLADDIQVFNNSKTLIEDILKFSSNKRVLKRSLKRNEPDNPMSVLLNKIEPFLEKYTKKSEDHLKKLPVSKIFDRRLATSREQYHLYMLEIELTNRRYASEFLNADRKIALLPYCLQDFSVSCKSEKTGFDYKCKHCSPGCYQNHTSKILEANNIEPYIWMEGDMKRLAQYTLKDKKTFGVLGIACIPELTWGMRNCRKNNIPVVGLPLNANRCARWFGEFFPNSVDLEELERISGIRV
jgi:hypothetical protein